MVLRLGGTFFCTSEFLGICCFILIDDKVRDKDGGGANTGMSMTRVIIGPMGAEHLRILWRSLERQPSLLSAAADRAGLITG